MAQPVFEQREVDDGMRIWQSPALQDCGVISAIGEVPTGDDGLDQWALGTRYNFAPAEFPDGDRPAVEAVNAHGYEMMEHWAALAALEAVARPLGSKGDGSVVHVGRDDFRRTESGLLVATTSKPADALIITQDSIPDGVNAIGISYGMADSTSVLVADRGGDRAAVIHGIRNGVINGVGKNAIAGMIEAGANPEELVAVVGPGIGVCCDEVGMQEHAQPLKEGGTVARTLTAIETGVLPTSALADKVDNRGGRTVYYFDATRALLHQLEQAGVGTIVSAAECTAQLAKGGHVRVSTGFPSKRRADERGQHTIVAPDGSMVGVPVGKPDYVVSRYPVMIGIHRQAA